MRLSVRGKIQFGFILFAFAACSSAPKPGDLNCLRELEGKHARIVAESRKQGIDVDHDTGLKQTDIAGAIEARSADFKACHEKAFAPALYSEGVVTLRFRVDGGGKVAKSCVLESTFEDAHFNDCIANVMKEIRFPPPKLCPSVKVTFPFKFTKSADG